MPESSVHPLESILRLCAAAAPEPWYPSAYAKETNTPRDTLDPYLDQLRMAGLVHLTDWVPGHGQGYALTPAGEDVLKDPRQLARLLAGKWSLRVVRDDRPQARAAPSPWERGEAVREALMYPVQPVVTFTLIAVNVIIFLIRYGSQDLYQQIEAWAVAAPVALLQHQWWRLLTTAFLHQNLMHVGFNMYALYALGQNAERIWGHGRYLLIYVIGALGCTCLALITQPIPCIGASGAVCGIFAAEAVWAYYHREFLNPRIFAAWQRNFVINLVLLVIISFFPNVSWAGHLGGAIAGLLVALCFSYSQAQVGLGRWLSLMGVILVPIVSIGLLVRTMNTSADWIRPRKAVESSGPQRESEIREFEGKYLPQVQAAIQGAKKIEGEVGELLEMNPSRRKNVDQAIAEIDAGIESLSQMTAMLQRRDPFITPLVEEARSAGLNDIEARLELLRLFKECLEKGEKWTEKDEERLQQQKQKVEKAETHWRALLK
ncbi:MAG TPA: rhomboid family intramembrane serine protease [Gemmataceae bacterium]|jgi:membrane associated rhomboid family serine protease|nr:rhomboid family intramembrane serine protease [Gemmataceae bacterium]